MLIDNPSYPRVRPARLTKNILAFDDSVSSLRRILHKDLGLFAYKVQLMTMRFNIAVWALDQLENDGDFAHLLG